MKDGSYQSETIEFYDGFKNETRGVIFPLIDLIKQISSRVEGKESLVKNWANPIKLSYK